MVPVFMLFCLFSTTETVRALRRVDAKLGLSGVSAFERNVGERVDAEVAVANDPLTPKHAVGGTRS